MRDTTAESVALAAGAPGVASSSPGLPSATEPSTPTARRALRKGLFWILAIVALIAIAIGVTAISQKAAKGAEFGATNPAPGGSEALANVLSAHGVTVTEPASLAAATAALKNPETTLFLYDPENNLSQTQLTGLTKTATTIVLLTPGYPALRALAPAVNAAGIVNKTQLAATCALPAATKAQNISGAGNGYRVTDKSATTVSCFGSGDTVYTLIETSTTNAAGEPQTTTVLGATDALTNEHIAERGNAALALNLLGSKSHLVWYHPTIADSSAGATATLGSLTPPWVSPALILLIIATLAAALWRGRRFGPLIIENLPVVVRSNETMQGRARLYQKSGARHHALDALRIGTIDRLARHCGLPRLASVTDVIAATATISGRDHTTLRHLLLDAVPASDRELVRLSDELLELEQHVSRSIRPH